MLGHLSPEPLNQKQVKIKIKHIHVFYQCGYQLGSSLSIVQSIYFKLKSEEKTVCFLLCSCRVKVADRFMKFNMLTTFTHWHFYSFPIETGRLVNLQALWMIFLWVSTDFKSEELIHSDLMLQMVAVWDWVAAALKVTQTFPYGIYRGQHYKTGTWHKPQTLRTLLSHTVFPFDFFMGWGW